MELAELNWIPYCSTLILNLTRLLSSHNHTVMLISLNRSLREKKKCPQVPYIQNLQKTTECQSLTLNNSPVGRRVPVINISIVYSWLGATETVVLLLLPELTYNRSLLNCVQEMGPRKN